MLKVLDTETGLASEVSAFRSPKRLKAITSELGWKIYQELARAPASPVDLAKKMKIHEQKVYYHVNQLRKAELIRLIRTEERQGALTKFYGSRPEALVVTHENMESHKLKFDSENVPETLREFVSSGRANFKIVVGSPDPHGKYKARGSDSCCAIDLALFLGSFTNNVVPANYKLDTEMRENDYRQNLVIVGGPKANMLTAALNEGMKVYMDEADDWNIVSKLSGKSYGEDDNGFIVMAKNPWDETKRVIVFAGRRFPGTRATVIAFVKHFNEVMKGNKYDPRVSAKVVKGIDYDGDGIVDDVEFLE
ncbi:MAG: S-layer protein [Candidatus Aenigmarchaeota archaeon]|nr:S-layer protein [Candidatus Aenigmarchaeota archaeon]